MMKKYIFLLFATLLTQLGYSQGYQVTLRAPQFKSGIAYLTYYMGNSFNISDSAAVSVSGTCVFKGATKLTPGIYVLFFPGQLSRLEFLIDKQQQITITADTSDLINKSTISGSPENVLYQQYQKYVAIKGKQLQAERQAYALSTTRADSVLHENKYNTYTQELNTYRENIIKTKPASMMTALLNAMKDPKLPSKNPVTRTDSINNYQYYKTHYWDGITFMDDRIIRTPFFIKKLERYYREVMPKDADSISRDVDYKLLLARSSPEMFKFLLNWLTDEYINPKYMGQDAVFVRLFEKYHSKGISSWLNADQMEKISRRAYMQMANLIGEKGANLELLDKDDKPSPLYDVNADFTLLCFWDPNCGHCKEEIPRLDSIYQASWKQHNVKIYAVLTPDEKGNNKEEWIKFIGAKNLQDWVHVHQTKEMAETDNKMQRPGFRQLYDVIITPTLYLLDKEKHIIGKKLSWQQLNELLEVKWKNKTSN